MWLWFMFWDMQRDMLRPAITAKYSYTEKTQPHPPLWNVCVDKYLAYLVCCFDCKTIDERLKY